jgi:hypothetical protein
MPQLAELSITAPVIKPCAATPLHVDLLRVWGRLVCRGWYWVLFVGDVSPSSSVPLHAPHKKKRNEG